EAAVGNVAAAVESVNGFRAPAQGPGGAAVHGYRGGVGNGSVDVGGVDIRQVLQGYIASTGEPDIPEEVVGNNAGAVIAGRIIEGGSCRSGQHHRLIACAGAVAGDLAHHAVLAAAAGGAQGYGSGNAQGQVGEVPALVEG